MRRIAEAYFGLLNVAIVFCLAAMVVLVFGNVVLRYGFNSGIMASEELSRWLFVYLTFLGAIVAMREHGHLGVDTLVRRLPPAGRKVCLVASLLLMLYATWLFLKGSWVQTLINLDNAAPVTRLSVGFVYAAGVVFSVSVGLMLIAELARVVTGRVADADLVIVKESEASREAGETARETAERDRAGR
jgi:TRAP-type C4-dicarboxylate transport system permease small subunit